MKMKAAYLVAPGRIEIREVPRPEPGPGEVLVALKAVGVCGSDVHYYRNGRIGDQVVEYPYVIGHETAGIVEKNGPGSTRFRPGDAVAVEPAISCGKCRLCARGRPNLCPEVKFLGTPPVEGAFRQFMVMPERNLLPLPEGTGPAAGAFCEPLAVGLYAWEMVSPPPASAVLVIGCGPIGISIVMSAACAGADPLIVLEPIAERRRLATEKGATHALDSVDTGRAERLVKEITGGEGVSFSFEAAGKQEALRSAVTSTAIGGQVVIVGIPEGDWVLPAHEARRRELLIRNVRRAAFTTEKAIGMLASGQVNLSGVISHRFPLDKLEEALETAGDYRDGVIKAIVEPFG